MGLFWFILASLLFLFVLGALSLTLRALFDPKSTRKSLFDPITHLRQRWYDGKLPKPKTSHDCPLSAALVHPATPCPAPPPYASRKSSRGRPKRSTIHRFSVTSAQRSSNSMKSAPNSEPQLVFSGSGSPLTPAPSSSLVISLPLAKPLMPCLSSTASATVSLLAIRPVFLSDGLQQYHALLTADLGAWVAGTWVVSPDLQGAQIVKVLRSHRLMATFLPLSAVPCAMHASNAANSDSVALSGPPSLNLSTSRFGTASLPSIVALGQPVAVYLSFYHFVRPHRSLSLKHCQRTPAMAAGLTTIAGQLKNGSTVPITAESSSFSFHPISSMGSGNVLKG